MAKRVFNIIINTNEIQLGNKGYITYHKVNSIDKFRRFADKKYPNWRFATIYDNNTREKLEVITKN
jgi:hypothetical protein